MEAQAEASCRTQTIASFAYITHVWTSTRPAHVLQSQTKVTDHQSVARTAYTREHSSALEHHVTGPTSANSTLAVKPTTTG